MASSFQSFRFVDGQLALIANTPLCTKNTVTVASASDRDAILAGLSRIGASFSSVTAGLHFATSTGRALGVAMLREEGNLLTVAINVKELFGLEKLGDNFSADKRMDWMLSHELGHVLDRNAAALDKSELAYRSSKVAGLHPGGEFYAEAVDSRSKHKLLEWAYRYPMSLPADDPMSGKGSNTKAKEVFAQTIALYVNSPELMREHLPKSYAYSKQFIEQMASAPCLVGDRGKGRGTTAGGDARRGAQIGGEGLLRDRSIGISGDVRGFSGALAGELSVEKQSANASPAQNRIGAIVTEFLATKQNVYKINQFCGEIAKCFEQRIGVVLDSKAVNLQDLSAVFGDRSGSTDLRLQFGQQSGGASAALDIGKDLAVKLVTSGREATEEIANASLTSSPD